MGRRWGPSVAATAASAATASPALEGLFFGLFSSIASTGASSSGGRSGHTLDIRGGASVACISSTSIDDSPTKSGALVSISWIITPSA